MKTKAKDLIGRTFGRLQAIEVDGKINGKTAIRCICDCGSETRATVAHLVQGRRVSCGCYNPGRTTHGKRRSRVYGIWCDMIKRCYNKNCISYRYYGERGVTVCDRWRESFQNFFSDMGDPPDGLSIDRINPRLGYSPENCRWATYQQQAENRTCQKFYSYNGNEYTLPNLCRLIGVNYRTMRNRLFRSKMPFEKAVSFSIQHDQKD